MTAGAERSGGCLCGMVRYRVTGPPRSVGYCHCRMCQKSTGAPATSWATFKAAAFAFSSGSPRELRPSPGARRGFCGACGSPLTFRFEHAGTQWIDVTVASLDDPASLPPQYHIWTGSRIAWFDIADSLPRHAEAGPDLVPE